LQTLGDGESENPELEESDDEEDMDEGRNENTTRPSTPTAHQVSFEIDSSININSKALLDMISETEVTVGTEKGAVALGPSNSKPANLEKKVSVAEAFENW
jgi:hypothetical protein